MIIDAVLKTQLCDMLNKAHRSLKAAQRHLDEGDYDFAASRAYYGAFYAMESALLSRGVTCSTHGGVLSEFSKQFIKDGTLPTDFGAKAARLFRERQTGDYEFDVSVTGSDAEEDVSIALCMVLAIEQFLVREDGKAL
ncbi:MAG TPA: HEPN domain-containing protein [Verrucomicrobia bacterium]|nr:HEPN domain-containing protein [Verrucomicrobiota bacterium]